MKKLLIIICYAFFTSSSSAQIRVDTCEHISKFNGEWLYTNGTDSIRIYLRAQRNFYDQNKRVDDRLFGWHEYTQGSTVIESTYANRFMNISGSGIVDTLSKNSFSIWLKMGTGVDCNSTPLKASGSITDYLQAKETKIVTVTLDPTGTIMTWKQRHSEGYGTFTGIRGADIKVKGLYFDCSYEIINTVICGGEETIN